MLSVDEMFRTMPQPVIDALNKAIDDIDDPCVDSLRAASENDAAELELYNDIKAGGCCGFYDEEIILNGTKYYIGFNYGH